MPRETGMGQSGAHCGLALPRWMHLGDSRLLAANKFTIHSGDTLRIIGETVSLASGTQFVARIVQNGAQAVAVRSSRGFPLSYVAPRNTNASKPQGGVL